MLVNRESVNRALRCFYPDRVRLGGGTAAVSLMLVIAVLRYGTAIASPGGRELVGRSVRGRPIYAYRVGEPGGIRVLVVGCTDGDEPAGMAIVAALRRLPPPVGVDLWLVPTINPDGVAAGTTGNAHGVDLNRNFPYAWKHLGGSGRLDSGPRPLSELESRAVYRFLLRVKPQLAIWFHQPLTLVDDSQGSRSLERTFGRLVGLPVERLTDYPGSITNWENHHFRWSTAFVTELPPGPLRSPGTVRYAHAILTLAQKRIATQSEGGIASRSARLAVRR
jgi:murein peptide amidase A